MDFRCIKAKCISAVVILSVPHAQKIMSNMPFFENLTLSIFGDGGDR